MAERLTVVDGNADLYAMGVRCTWHGPVGSARAEERMANGVTVEVKVCPECGGPCVLTGEELFWASTRKASRDGWIGYASLMVWSQGKCFPDHDTQLGAYRQAMEGR